MLNLTYKNQILKYIVILVVKTKTKIIFNNYLLQIQAKNLIINKRMKNYNLMFNKMN